MARLRELSDGRWRVLSGQAAGRVRGRARGSAPLLDRLAIGGVALIILMAVIGPAIAPYEPAAVNPTASLTAPSAAHWFGTDDLGRDVLSRILSGARTTVFASLVTVAGAVGIGLVVACIAAAGGRWLDEMLMRLCDIVLSLPVTVMAIGIAMALGPSTRSAVIAMISAMWPSFSRLARTEMRAVMTSTYVEAATVLGVSKARLMMRHVLPNSINSVWVQATLSVGGATIMMAGLSFIGVGSQAPSSEWGLMVQQGTNYLSTAWWVALIPGVFVVVTSLAFGLGGDALLARGNKARKAS